MRNNNAMTTLDSQFLYQDAKGNVISNTPLSATQICRLLTTKNPILQASTNVLPILQQGQVFGEWTPCYRIPLFGACVQQYYYAIGNQEETKGPVSIQEIQKLVAKQQSPLLRVYNGQEWSTIQDNETLQLALQALSTSTTTIQQPPHQHHSSQVQSELDAFLSGVDEEQVEEEEEAYESDGGTKYVKDQTTGKWIHQALVETQKQQQQPPVPKTTATTTTNKSKKRKANFAARNARNWIYVTGLPTDTDETEVETFFSKAGILDLDPQTQKPKVKLYRNKDNQQLKGDASICYARPESVELALTILDEANFRVTTYPLSVQRAKFEQRGEEFKPKTTVSEAQRKVAKLASLQKMDWDEGEINGRLTGGRKGLHIVVLKGMFDPSKFFSEQVEDATLRRLEKDLREEAEEWGEIEKMTVFAKNPQGVVVIKFTLPGAASQAVEKMNGRQWKGVGRVEASFWDGVTDYTVKDEIKEEKEMKQRLDAFGDWLDNQEIPEELRLKTEED